MPSVSLLGEMKAEKTMRENSQLTKVKIVENDEFYTRLDVSTGNMLCSRVRYVYDAEGRIATLAATNAANRGFQVEYFNESGYNYF